VREFGYIYLWDDTFCSLHDIPELVVLIRNLCSVLFTILCLFELFLLVIV